MCIVLFLCVVNNHPGWIKDDIISINLYSSGGYYTEKYIIDDINYVFMHELLHFHLPEASEDVIENIVPRLEKEICMKDENGKYIEN